MNSAGCIVIAGGTGFLGLNLTHELRKAGREIVLLSRRPPRSDPGCVWERWDARTVGDWARHLDGAAALVNLAGRSVDCVKTPDHCDEILRSRVESTVALGRAVKQVNTPPPVWAQMSTAHLYGDPPEVVCDEDAAFGCGLAPFVARAWEEAFEQSRPADTRGVVLRTSFVLGRHGGALQRLKKLARWGLGGKVGHGRQGFSWIHERDMNRLFVRAITDDAMTGAYLATAPHPVSQDEFMRELRSAMGVSIGLPATTWMVRLGAPWVLKTDPELAIYGRYCASRRLSEDGFPFEFPDLKSALDHLCRAKTGQSSP